jgi:hypothetical protein
MPGDIAETWLENKTFDALNIGDTASLSHTVMQRDIDLFATVTGDVNPAHVDPAYAETDMFHHIIIQGMWGAGLIITVAIFCLRNALISESMGDHESEVMDFGFTNRSDAGVLGEVTARCKGAYPAAVYAGSCCGFGKRLS